MTAEDLTRQVVEYIGNVCTEKRIGHFEYNRFLDKMKDWVESEQWQQEHIGPLYDDD